MKIGDIPALARLLNVPLELLQFPSHGTEEVLPKLVGKPSPYVTLLQAFGNAVESYQKRYQSVSDWFPEIQLGQLVESGVVATYHEAARIIGELGLADQNLESVAQLLEKVEKSSGKRPKHLSPISKLISRLGHYFSPKLLTKLLRPKNYF